RLPPAPTLYPYTTLFRSSIMPMGLDILRDRNQLFRENSEGLIENTYTLKILNKTLHAQTYQLDVEGLPEHEWFGPREVTLKAGRSEEHTSELQSRENTVC